MQSQNYTLNQETMEVTINRPWEIFGETMDYFTFYAMNFTIQHLSWSGQYKDVLTSGEWEQAYLMCDGFGQVDQAWAKEQSYDWSHVRDSQPETLVKVAEWIASKKWHLNSIEAIVSDMIAQCRRIGLNPVLAVPGIEE